MEYGAELVGRARELAPVLAKRAAAAEETRRLPDETIDDLANAGLLDVLVPRALGGAELGLDTFVGICREIGAGCLSTGWVTAVYGLHNWIFTLFPERAQREIFADRSYALAPLSLQPAGRAEPVDGGYQVTGRWSWGSGLAHAGWVMVCAMVTTEGRTVPRVFLIPRDEIVVHDVWFTSGMRATGSNDMEVPGRFVPEHRSISLLDLAQGTTPGAAIHPGPAYRWPMVPVFVIAGTSPVLGAAEGLLTQFRERMRTRVLAITGERQRDLVSSHLRLARATADVGAARLMLEDSVTRLTSTYAGGAQFDLQDRARVRLMAGHVGATTRTTINDLCAASGARAQLTESPFQRVQRDINTITGHMVYDLDAVYALYGKVELGIDLDPATLL